MSVPTHSLRDQGVEALKNGQIDLAIDILSRVVVSQDDDAEAKALLGVAYSQKGLHNQAKRALQTAVELQPQNPNFQFNLGVAYERAGDLKAAAIAWRDALHYSPNHPQSKAKLKALGPQAQALLADAPPPRATPVGIRGIHPSPGEEASFESYSIPPAVGMAPSQPIPSTSPSQAGAGYAPTGGPPGTIQCPSCGQWARPGVSCEFCSGMLRPPAPAPLPPPAQQMYTHTPGPGYMPSGWQMGMMMPTGEAFFRRLGATLLDSFMMSIVGWMVGFVIGLVGVAIGGDSPATGIGVMVAAYLSGLALAIGYYGGMLSYYGQTLGKMALGVRVVGPDGGNPGFVRAAVRETVGRFANGILCGLGYFWMLWDPEQQTWADKICSTHVVRA